MLLSEDISNESRVMFHRRLSVGARGADHDPDPYLVISNGRLFWLAGRVHDHGPVSLLDAGSQRRQLIRSSVKATVDAFHGTVVFYPVDDKDPVQV